MKRSRSADTEPVEEPLQRPNDGPTVRYLCILPKLVQAITLSLRADCHEGRQSRQSFKIS
jgi:hypothetical protein